MCRITHRDSGYGTTIDYFWFMSCLFTRNNCLTNVSHCLLFHLTFHPHIVCTLHYVLYAHANMLTLWLLTTNNNLFRSLLTNVYVKIIENGVNVGELRHKYKPNIMLQCEIHNISIFTWGKLSSWLPMFFISPRFQTTFLLQYVQWWRSWSKSSYFGDIHSKSAVKLDPISTV